MTKCQVFRCHENIRILRDTGDIMTSRVTYKAEVSVKCPIFNVLTQNFKKKNRKFFQKIFKNFFKTIIFYIKLVCNETIFGYVVVFPRNMSYINMRNMS